MGKACGKVLEAPVTIPTKLLKLGTRLDSRQTLDFLGCRLTSFLSHIVSNLSQVIPNVKKLILSVIFSHATARDHDPVFLLTLRVNEAILCGLRKLILQKSPYVF
jgi:hypothetical protein